MANNNNNNNQRKSPVKGAVIMFVRLMVLFAIAYALVAGVKYLMSLI